MEENVQNTAENTEESASVVDMDAIFDEVFNNTDTDENEESAFEEAGSAVGDTEQTDTAADADDAGDAGDGGADASGDDVQQDGNSEQQQVEGNVTVTVGGRNVAIAQDALNDVTNALGISAEQLTAAVQDSERYRAELERYKDFSGVLDTLQVYADIQGSTLEEFCDGLANDLVPAASGRIIGELKKKFPDSDPALLQQMADTQAEKRIADARGKLKDKPVIPNAPAQDNGVARWVKVRETFPEYKAASEIPKEVFDAVNAGADPVEAVYKHQLAAVKKQLEEAQRAAKTAEKNAKNAASAAGSMSSNGNAKDDSLDSYMDKLFG